MNKFFIPVVALSALGAPAMAAEVQIAATGPVVELTVTEAVEAEPDIVEVGAGVSTLAPTAVEAMRQNSTQMQAVVNRLKQLRVPEKDIQTVGISLGAQYDYDQETRQQVFRGYQASNRVNVKLHDIQRTGEVLDALVAAGATDLSGPSWSVDDDTAARSQARSAAMETARARAAEYARMAGYADVRLLEISETFSQPRGMPMYRSAVVQDAAAARPVQPGLVETSVTVTVKYELSGG